MATEKWIAGSGQGLTWGNAFTTATLDSIANGSAILSSIDIANGSPLDIFCDLAVTISTINVASPAFVGVYLYPLHSNGTTYGDGRFVAAGSGPPPYTYQVGAIGVGTGTALVYGELLRIIMPPGSFKFVIHNQLGVTLSTGNTCLYRTYNRQIA